jgi:hypothetical protein
MISDEYRKQNLELHARFSGYGAKGHKFADMVAQLASKLGVPGFLDYGCGKCTLAQSLPQFRVISYDPCIPGLDRYPEPSDLVVCTDVLEHIEPQHLQDVIDDLARLTNKILFATVHMGKARKDLPDGRNAHLLIKPVWWWIFQLYEYFDVSRLECRNDKDVGGIFIGIFEKRTAPCQSPNESTE